MEVFGESKFSSRIFSGLSAVGYICAMVKVLVTGPESSGKTYLVNHLAEHYKAPLVKEFARDFLEKNPNYQKTDLIRILKGQLHQEEMVSDTNPPLVFCDTGPEVIHIWHMEKYKEVSTEIFHLATNHFYDLVFLCKPNIPWEFDKLRENEEDRDYLFDRYVDFFQQQQITPFVIDEKLDFRLSQAIQVINERYPGLKNTRL